MSVVMVKKNVFEKLGGLNAAIWDLDDLHFYLRLAVSHEVRYVHYIGCRKRIAVDNLLPQTTLDGLVQCLEDLKRNHPDVVRAVGPLKVRVRLARRYRKLGERYMQGGQSDLARRMYLKALLRRTTSTSTIYGAIYLARVWRKASSLIER